MRDKVNPDTGAHVQLQHADTGVQEVEQGLCPGSSHPKDVFEIDVGEDIESVHCLDGNIVGRGSEFLGIEVCNNKSPPEKGSVPIEGHPVLAGIRCEEA